MVGWEWGCRIIWTSPSSGKNSLRRFCCRCFQRHMTMKTTSSRSMKPSTLPRMTGWSMLTVSRRLVVSGPSSAGFSGGIGGGGKLSGGWPSVAASQQNKPLKNLEICENPHIQKIVRQSDTIWILPYLCLLLHHSLIQ